MTMTPEEMKDFIMFYHTEGIARVAALAATRAIPSV